MADIITGTTTGFVNNLPDNTYKEISDTRREVAKEFNDANLENMKGFDRVNADVQTQGAMNIAATKDARRDLVDTITNSKDSTLDRLFAIGRDIVDNRTQIVSLGYQIRDGFVAAAKDAEINALKTQIDAAKNTTYLSDKIGAEGDATRALINNLNNGDLNRRLIERNAALVEALEGNRFWRDRADQGQWANLQSQIQAFGSNLQDTKNSLVNFGSMSKGSGNLSTSSNQA